MKIVHVDNCVNHDDDCDGELVVVMTSSEFDKATNRATLGIYRPGMVCAVVDAGELERRARALYNQMVAHFTKEKP